MKKILVTGAAGTIGLVLLKYLLSEGKYEITALDLKNKNVHSKLKKYRNRINIIYGDVCDRILMEALIKDHDYVIHLASVLPPLGMLKKDLSKLIEHDALENIIRSINYYNPNCFLIYASSTTLYGDIDQIKINSKITYEQGDYYSLYKFLAEKLIKEKLKKYTIARIPYVLPESKKDSFIYNVKKNSSINCITKIDAAYALIRLIDENKNFNKKSINLTSGIDFNIKYSDLLKKILDSRGFSYKFLLSDIFIEKNYYSPINNDDKKENILLNYQKDTLDNYFNRLTYNFKGSFISKFIAKIYVKFWRRK